MIYLFFDFSNAIFSHGIDSYMYNTFTICTVFPHILTQVTTIATRHGLS